MNPRIKAVKPNVDYTLTLTFTNDEVKVFDVKPYLDKGIFKELRDLSIFNSVKPFLGSIQWKNEQDFCPDTLYLNSISLEQFSEVLANEKPDTAIPEIKNQEMQEE